MGRGLQTGRIPSKGPVFLATVKDLFSRRLLGFASLTATPPPGRQHGHRRPGRRRGR